MSYFINICFICLKNSYNLTFIKSQDTNGTSIEDKLKYYLPRLEFNSSTPKYICTKCGFDLNKYYEFKQICLRNITTYEKYAQQITTTDSSYKYLSVSIEEISNINNYDTDNAETKTEDEDVGYIEEIIIREEITIKEEKNEELELVEASKSSLHDIKEENFQSDFADENNYGTNISEALSEINENVLNSEEFIIKEETNEKLVLDDELQSLLHDLKEENYKTDDACNKNDNIIEEDSSNKKVCKKSFRHLGNLKDHQVVHTGEKPFSCEVCNKSFRHNYLLKKHKLIHIGEKPFTCEICNKSFTQLKTLKLHRTLHTGEKPFTCEVCNTSFRLPETLKKHKLIHSDEKPFTCEVCNKSFKHSNTLKIHRLLHTGEKPFTCEVCNTSFRLLEILRKHKLIHTGEKPFTCGVCNKSFRHSGTLKIHRVVHTGEKPFTCEVCNESFRHPQPLKKHKLLHTSQNTLF